MWRRGRASIYGEGWVNMGRDVSDGEGSISWWGRVGRDIISGGIYGEGCVGKHGGGMGGWLNGEGYRGGVHMGRDNKW